MQKIADDVGVHETTISRAIANNNAKTPHGVFPLKHFLIADLLLKVAKQLPIALSKKLLRKSFKKRTQRSQLATKQFQKN